MNQKTQPATAAPIVQAAQKKKYRITIQREIAVLLAMIVFNLLFTQHFWSLQTFNVNLTQVVTIVIVGIGMTLVVATGGIDLSVGASMAIAGSLAPMIFMNVARFGSTDFSYNSREPKSRCQYWALRDSEAAILRSI